MCQIICFKEEYEKRNGMSLKSAVSTGKVKSDTSFANAVSDHNRHNLTNVEMFDRIRFLDSVVSFCSGIPTEDGYLYAEYEFNNVRCYEALAYEVVEAGMVS